MRSLEIKGNDIDGNRCSLNVQINSNGQVTKVTSIFSQVPYMGFQEIYFMIDPVNPDLVTYNEPKILLEDLSELGFAVGTDQNQSTPLSCFIERYRITFLSQR
jgi:hypothetical protein